MDIAAEDTGTKVDDASTKPDPRQCKGRCISPMLDITVYIPAIPER